MIRALRVVTVERGVDPRGFALMPFGGAGPMHAAAIAEELGIERLLCPRASGVLSALGLLASDRRRDTARTVMLQRRGADGARGSRRRSRRCATRSARGSPSPQVEVTYELRYRGQAFELPVEGERAPGPGELAERFAAEHERRYGYRDPEAEVDLVTVRLALIEPGPAPSPQAAGGGELRRSTRRARFGDRWHEAEVLRGEPAAGDEAEGPCVFELPGGHPDPAARLAGARRRRGHDRRGARADERRRARSGLASGAGRGACAPPATRWARC